MAFVDDVLYFRIDGACRFFAVRLDAIHATQIWVSTFRQLYHAQLVTHTPARNHLPGDAGSLFNIIFRSAGFGSVDNLLGRPSAQNANNPGPEVIFGIVVAVTFGPLVGYPQSLPAGYDGYSVYRVG